MAVCQNLVPLVNIKIAGKWMFIPLKMVLIGIDPYPYCQYPIQNSASELLILPSAPASLKPCCCLLALAICGTEGLCEASLRAQKLKVNGGLHKWGHPKMVGFSLTLLLKYIKIDHLGVPHF